MKDMSEDKLLKFLTEAYIDMPEDDMFHTEDPVDGPAQEQDLRLPPLKDNLKDVLAMKLDDGGVHPSDTSDFVSYADAEEDEMQIILQALDMLGPDAAKVIVDGEFWPGQNGSPKELEAYVEFIKQGGESPEGAHTAKMSLANHLEGVIADIKEMGENASGNEKEVYNSTVAQLESILKGLGGE